MTKSWTSEVIWIKEKRIKSCSQLESNGFRSSQQLPNMALCLQTTMRSSKVKLYNVARSQHEIGFSYPLSPIFLSLWLKCSISFPVCKGSFTLSSRNIKAVRFCIHLSCPYRIVFCSILSFSSSTVGILKILDGLPLLEEEEVVRGKK